MVFVAVYTIPYLLLLATIYILVAKLHSARIAYLSISWLPLALLLFMYAYQGYLDRTLSYGVILLGVLIAASSLVLGMIGVALVIRATSRREPRTAVVVSTIIAFVPAVVYLKLLLV